MTTGIKGHKSIKKKRKHDKIILLRKTKLNRIKDLISRALINSYIIHDGFVSVNNVLREYDNMKKAIKNLKASAVHQRL